QIRPPVRSDLLGGRGYQLSRLEAWAFDSLRTALDRSPSSLVDYAQDRPPANETDAAAESADLSLDQSSRSDDAGFECVVGCLSGAHCGDQVAARLYS